MKKVLVITDIYPRSSSDYKGIFVENFVRCVHSTEMQVDVINVNLVPISQAKLSQLYFSRKNNCGQNTIQIGAFSLLPRSTYFFSFMHFLLSLIAFAFLYKKYDLIHAHNGLFSGNSARLIGNIFKIPFVLTEHRKSYPEFIRSVELKIYGKVIMAAQKILLPSESFRQSFCSVFPDVGSKSIYFPNILGNQFTRSLNDKKRYLIPDPVKILFVGNLIELKGPDLIYDSCQKFIEMYAGNSNLELVFVGTGSLRFELENKYQRSCDRRITVRFEGALDQNTLRDQYDSATVVCIPSRSETFCCALAESISRGTPVIAIKGSGGPDDFVRKENGILVQRNLEAIAEGVKVILDRIREQRYQYSTMRKTVNVYINEISYRESFSKDVLQRCTL